MGRVFPITLRRTFGALPEVYQVTWAPSGNEPSILNLYQTHRGLRLKSPTRPDEKPPDLPLIAFGAFDQIDRKGPGCRGSNLNLEGIHALAFDFDDVTPAQAIEALQRAKKFSNEGLAHTTWQHGLSGLVRMRVVMPLPAPVARNAWGAFWDHANNALGGLADQQCRNIDRFYYLPCVNLDAPGWVLAQDGGCWFESWGT